MFTWPLYDVWIDMHDVHPFCSRHARRVNHAQSESPSSPLHLPRNLLQRVRNFREVVETRFIFVKRPEFGFLFLVTVGIVYIALGNK